MRVRDWKYIPDVHAEWQGLGKKGNDKLGPWGRYTTAKGGELFNLARDPGAAWHPEMLKQIQSELKAIQEDD